MECVAEITTITEGCTKIHVPKDALTQKAPPKEPAFFNPQARLNRDYSIIAYQAFIRNFEGPKVFLEGLSGLGARGLRVANEIKQFEKIILNDLNSNALELASRSIKENHIQNIELSKEEACSFFSKYSKARHRGTIVDIDPFGSPAKFLDCCVRATIHGGMLSITATDLQVLNGLFQNACMRRYGGTPIRVEYGNEIAIRLVLGCLRHIAARLDITFCPLFVESNHHYYRTYVKILNHPDQAENMGFLYHCRECGNRGSSTKNDTVCRVCNGTLEHAGPLWIGSLFDKEFVHTMEAQIKELRVDATCEKTIKKALAESEMPPTYYTIDDVASRLKISPHSPDNTIRMLQSNGYTASPTSLCPTGFRTDAKMDEMAGVFT